jgi:N-acetyl-gamma-glutamyl-phosphate reductase
MTVTCPVSSSTFTQPDTPFPATATATAAATAGTQPVQPLVRVADDPACGGVCAPPDPVSAAGVVTVAVVGGSGFTGALLAELLLRHPKVSLEQMSSARLAGAPVADHLPRLHTGLRFCAPGEIGGVDVAFVCAPHGQAAHAVSRLLDDGARVIDLSADFRLDADAYAAWYRPHPCPELLPEAVYGLTELHRAQIAAARLVANPGCYPTAALLALAPLASLGLLDVVIDAKSGVSGAGRTPSERTHFCSIAGDLVAYGLAGHRHYPEIVAGLAAAAESAAGRGETVAAAAEDAASPERGDASACVSTSSAAPTVTFVPHLMPVDRGIVETIYVRAARLPSAATLRDLYAEVYAGERFVTVSEAPPELKDVVGTNGCRIFVTVHEQAQRLVVVAAIDNLMKGASGQAVQNLNCMAGFPEHWGLT